MSRTAPLPSSSGTFRADVIWVGRDALIPNPWNPNKMNAFMYSKALESIQMYGFLDPLLVRPFGNGVYQIIDGEHRWRAACDLGTSSFPCVVRECDDATAKKLTIVLNELHGQASPAAMGDLLKEILDGSSVDDLLRGLPYTEDILSGMIGLPALPLPPPPPGPALSSGPVQVGSKEPWVERTYRLPKTVALVIDEAIEKAKDGEELEAWQGLERVAADYLAS